MNPPYSEIGDWTTKAKMEVKKGATVVALLPVRTAMRWFHRDVLPLVNAAPRHGKVVFLRERINFVGGKWKAPFDPMVVVFLPKKKK